MWHRLQMITDSVMKVVKNVFDKLMLCNIGQGEFECRGMYVGMKVPKTTEGRFRDGSVQKRQVVKDYTSNPIPIHLLLTTH